MKKLMIWTIALGSLSTFASGGTYNVLKFYLSQSEIQNKLSSPNNSDNCEVSSPSISSLFSS